VSCEEMYIRENCNLLGDSVMIMKLSLSNSWFLEKESLRNLSDDLSEFVKKGEPELLNLRLRGWTAFWGLILRTFRLRDLALSGETEKSSRTSSKFCYAFDWDLNQPEGRMSAMTSKMTWYVIEEEMDSGDKFIQITLNGDLSFPKNLEITFERIKSSKMQDLTNPGFIERTLILVLRLRGKNLFITMKWFYSNWKTIFYESLSIEW